MSWDLGVDADHMVLHFGGADRLLLMRARMRVPLAAITDAYAADRAPLEALVERRLTGRGGRRGDRRPGRPRVGLTLAGGTDGMTVWAVGLATRLLVVEVGPAGGRCSRFVVEVPTPEALAGHLRSLAGGARS